MISKEIDIEYIPQFTRLFSKKVVKDLLSKEKSEILNRVILNSKINFDNETTYFNIFERIYNLFINRYPYEYVYKNELLVQLLKKEYKTKHTFLQEVPIYNNIVDILVVNGKTTAYEIKTEFDSFYRLDSQLKSYLKVFDRVFVITSEKFQNKIIEFLDNNEFNNVGVQIFSNNKIKQVRQAKLNNIEILNYRNIINQSELKKINLDFESVEKLNIKKALEIYRNILKLRQKNGNDLVHKVPDSIKSLISNMHLLTWQKEKLIYKLSKNYICSK
ncbi:sce7726 family protein [Aliarcobacter butzleri]